MKILGMTFHFVITGSISLVIMFSSVIAVHARSFEGEGSDLLMGVGARNIALGGAVTASSYDIYSTYWNPAGLAEIDENQLALSRQLGGTLDPLSFAGIAITHPRLTFWGYKTVLAYSWIPRLHIKASGKYDSDDLESVFTNYALPGLPTDFDGNIESKTREHRMTLALTPAADPAWSVGVNIGRVDCGTEFCGTFAADPDNYTIASTGATAITVGFGAKYHASEQLTVGINVKDLDTKLDVETIVTDSNGTETKTFETNFPREITTGILFRYQEDVALTADFQYVSGEYGDSEIDFRIVRAGFEKKANNIYYRFGLIVPLELQTSSQNFTNDLPIPFFPTVGAGWDIKWADINFAIYPNPLMSYTNNSVEISTDISFVFKF